MIPSPKTVVLLLSLGLLAGGGLATAEAGNPDKLRLKNGKFQPPITREKVEADWKSRGFKLDLAYFPKGYEHAEHTHGFGELITVLHGPLEILIEGRRTVIEPGDELYLPAGTRHAVRNLHDDFIILFFAWDY